MNPAFFRRYRSTESVSLSRRAFLRRFAAVPAAASLGAFHINVRAAETGSAFSSDNPVIARGREAALAILKPSAQELERGYRLHQESLVFESYGFAPRAAVDATRVNAAVASGASDRELVDLREEMAM